MRNHLHPLQLHLRAIRSVCRLAPGIVAISFGWTESTARAQTCAVHERQFVPAPEPFGVGNQFGYRVALSGDHALVAAIGNGQFASGGGAVYALHRDGETWAITQTLGEGLVNAGDMFGSALAMDADVAVIASPRLNAGMVNDVGGAFVFRLIDGNWTFEQQLMAGDPNANDRFGTSVAIDGNLIVIGALLDDGAATDAGAAYAFRHNGTGWFQEQKLIEANPAANRRMGQAVAVVGDVAVVSRGFSDHQGAVLFRHEAGAWSSFQTITSLEATAWDEFGYVLAFDGQTLVLGAPGHNQPPSQNGAAYVYVEQNKTWTFAQKLFLAGSFPQGPSARFGAAVAVQDDAIVVGAPFERKWTFPSEPYTMEAGGVHLYRNPGTSWAQEYAGEAKPRFSWDSFADDNAGDRLGTSVAIDGGTIVAGGPRWEFAQSPSGVWGKALFFDRDPPDCDRNGVPDSCDPDCNHNTLNDACEIAASSADDCNMNGQPDECEQGFDYQLDNGQTTQVWGMTGGGDMMWLNHFSVQSGGQRLTHVTIGWTAYGPEGLPGQIVVYDDPNNDGNPDDAVLLVSAPVTQLENFGTSGSLGPSMYRIPTTFVGEPGEKFFAGVVMSLPPDTFVAARDNAASHASNRLLTAALGKGNINNLSSGWSVLPASGDWMVRGIALDCNGNGVWDQCDIDAGTSPDLNNNGIIDECEATCAGDVNGSGAVDVDDLIGVILAWGPCPAPPAPCPADVNTSGSVDVDDLIAVILAWGPC
jgi:hypothetical protein